ASPNVSRSWSSSPGRSALTSSSDVLTGSSDSDGMANLRDGFKHERPAMPLQDHMHIISVDDHLIEHPRVWTDRLPSKYQDDAPQIVELDGAQVWKYAGALVP